MRHEPILIAGHLLFGRFYDFPHLCPGPDCAVARWLEDREFRYADRDDSDGEKEAKSA